MPRSRYWVVALVAIALALLPGVQAQEKKSGDEPTLAASAPVQLVGLLTKQYRGRCGADGQHKWDDEHWEVGFVRLDVPETIDLSKFEGKAVVVTGQPAGKKKIPPPEYFHTAMELNPKPEGPGIECPQYQMRSDWVIGKNGMRIMRPRSNGLPPRVTVTEASLFDSLRAELKEGKLEVSLANDFKGSLKGLKVRVNYEGCYGKPGSDSRSEKIDELTPGARKKFVFPTIVDEDQGERWGVRHHRAYSIQLLSSAGDVLFDYDLPVVVFGVAGIDCPKEK